MYSFFSITVCKVTFIYEIRIALFQLLYFYVEIRIPGTTDCYTSIVFTEGSYENVKVALSVGEVDIFYFRLPQCIKKTHQKNKKKTPKNHSWYSTIL